MSEHKDPFAEACRRWLAQADEPQGPTYRRFLTPAECKDLGLPYGTEGQTDKEGNLRQAPAEPRPYIERVELAQTVFGELPGPANMVPAPDTYDQRNMRLQCLSMALAVPDGAAPPSLNEVIERAVRYWRFVSSGE